MSEENSRSEELMKLAVKAMDRAYVPYSRFRVGAALRCGSGHVYTGCNIENASYGATCCAERTAMFKAISEGETDFVELAVAADTKEPCSPCGICRQVMVELGPKMTVWLGNLHGNVMKTSSAELLPFSFTQSSMETQDDKEQ